MTLTPLTPMNSEPSPTQLLVSIATVPLLLGLLARQALMKASDELGQLSEEVFRGERLPILNVPATPSTDPEVEVDQD